MKGLFIPDITAEMFRNGCLEGIEALMAEGEIYDIEYEPRQGEWIDAVIPNGDEDIPIQVCSRCNTFFPLKYTGGGHHFCPNCGARMQLDLGGVQMRLDLGGDDE